MLIELTNKGRHGVRRGEFVTYASIFIYFTGLVNEILKTRLDLDGSNYKMKVFDTNGDGNIGYRIYNIQKDDVDLSKLVYREVESLFIIIKFLYCIYTRSVTLTTPSCRHVVSKVNLKNNESRKITCNWSVAAGNRTRVSVLPVSDVNHFTTAISVI